MDSMEGRWPDRRAAERTGRKFNSDASVFWPALERTCCCVCVFAIVWVVAASGRGEDRRSVWGALALSITYPLMSQSERLEPFTNARILHTGSLAVEAVGCCSRGARAQRQASAVGVGISVSVSISIGNCVEIAGCTISSSHETLHESISPQKST